MSMRPIVKDGRLIVYETGFIRITLPGKTPAIADDPFDDVIDEEDVTLENLITTDKDALGHTTCFWQRVDLPRAARKPIADLARAFHFARCQAEGKVST